MVESHFTSGASIYTLFGIKNKVIASVNNKLDLKEKPTRVDEKKRNSFLKSIEVFPWGSDNLYPQNALADIKCLSLAMRCLKFRQDSHFGRGLIIYKEGIDNTSETIRKIPTLDTNVKAFWKANNINKLQFGLINDWEFFRNIFVEIILSADGKKINKIFRQPAMNCRWEKMDLKKRAITNLHISSSWGYCSSKEEILTIPCLDWDDPITDLRNRMAKGDKTRRFILPIRLEELDQVYYDYPFWDGIRTTWLDIALQIPAVKSAMLRNQMVLKFHIKIPYSYWSNKYKDWDQFSSDEQATKILELTNQLNTFLTDAENYGKSFISHYGVDPIRPDTNIEEIKIEPIDNTKIKTDGQFVVDAKNANGEIVTAFGVDPTLLGGFLPGGGEAGSGSNKREAFYIHQAQIFPDRCITTKWFDYVKDYNGWDEDLKMGYMDIDTSQTLNENPTGKKTVA